MSDAKTVTESVHKLVSHVLSNGGRVPIDRRRLEHHSSLTLRLISANMAPTIDDDFQASELIKKQSEYLHLLMLQIHRRDGLTDVRSDLVDSS
jgi:hypothetical protein